MSYDPFLSEPQAKGHLRNTLISFRRAPILGMHLSHLEWHSTESRKRPRPEPTHSSAQPDQSGTANARDNVPSLPADRNNQRSQPQPAQSSQQASNHQPSNSHAPSSSQKPLEILRVVEKPVIVEPSTIMGAPPIVDDRVRQLVHFILRHVTDANIEIEAKLGVLIEKDQDVRVISLVPVMCETPIREESNGDVRFVSDVGENMFKNVNERLNTRVRETNGQTEGRITYERKRETDVYYPGRVRQTRHQVNRSQNRDEYKVVRTQRKSRLGDLNVLCPGGVCDIRYSASREENCEVTQNTRQEYQREKDRISYKFEYVSVDITTVESVTNPGSVGERTHEVEVEIDSSTNLFEEARKYRDGDESSKLFDIATNVVHTVRVLLEL